MNFDPSLPTSYEYIHYASENTDTLDLDRIYAQTAENLAFHTPNGLWLSVTGKNDWENYCLKNNYHLENLKSEFQILLKPAAKILILYNNSVFEVFEKKYCNYGENNAPCLSIAWERIISDYQGIVVPTIFPKLFNMSEWYDIWRCTCACIWDLQAVKKAEKLDCSKDGKP